MKTASGFSPAVLDALEVCLAAQETGVETERLLNLYPEHAEALSAPLEGAELARALRAEGPSSESTRRVRAQVLQRAAALRRKQSRAPLFQGMRRLSWAFVWVLALLLVSGYGLYSAAAQALPGETLYPVKRSLENLHLQLAPAQRHTLEEAYNQRRVDEVQALIHSHSGGYNVSFWGTVEEQSDGRWVVDSIPLQLAPDVRIIGDIRVGMVIEVEGETTAEGWLLARELHLNRRDLVGEVQSIAPSEWQVNGVVFRVTGMTTFDGVPIVGDPVLVTLQAEEDGSLLAEHIVRLVPLNPGQTPEIIPTPLPTYTLPPAETAAP